MKLDNWNYNELTFFADLGEEYGISQYDGDSWLLTKSWSFCGDSETIWELVFDGELKDVQEFVEADYLADKKRREIEDKLLMEECYRAMDEFREQEDALKDEWKEKLEGLINVNDLYDDLSENDFWTPEGIVEIEKITDKETILKKLGIWTPHIEACIIKGENNFTYSKNECDLADIDHYYVWQEVGYLGDDYSGYLLYPLNDGRYFKVSYSC